MKCFIGLIKISVETIGEKENGEKNKGEGGGMTGKRQEQDEKWGQG